MGGGFATGARHAAAGTKGDGRFLMDKPCVVRRDS